MSGSSKCMLILTAEIDADFEKEWNAGYDAVHFPDMLCTAWRPWRPDIRDQRGQSSPTTGCTPHPVENPTALYEIDGPTAMEPEAFKAMRRWHHFAARTRTATRIIPALQDIINSNSPP
jgi:hypothetical protein